MDSFGAGILSLNFDPGQRGRSCGGGVQSELYAGAQSLAGRAFVYFAGSLQRHVL